MDYRFEIDLRAVLEADDAHRWMAARSVDGADRWYRGLFEQIQTLAVFPMRCPLVEGMNHPDGDVRELLYGKRSSTYRILFLVRDDVIRILSVWRASRGSIQL
jgi:plasmid stabilization system protein ParE